MRSLCTYVPVPRCQYPTIRVKSSRGALKVIVVSQVRPSATILLLSVLLSPSHPVPCCVGLSRRSFFCLWVCELRVALPLIRSPAPSCQSSFSQPTAMNQMLKTKLNSFLVHACNRTCLRILSYAQLGDFRIVVCWLCADGLFMPNLWFHAASAEL